MLRQHTKSANASSDHFVTTVTRVRGQWFTQPKLCNSILELLEGYRKKQNLDCLGYVLMPDHLHVLLRQWEDGPHISCCLRDFKKVSSTRCRPRDFPPVTLWADGFDDVLVPGPRAITTKLNYMHLNPVRKGLILEMDEYPWSSAGFFYKELPSIVTVTRVQVENWS